MEILAILVSPVIAVLVTMWIADYKQKRNDRLEVFKSLMTTRESWSTLEFVRAINSIDVIFCERPKVRDAWVEFRKSLDVVEPTSNQLESIQINHMKLLEAMANDLGYKDKITWEHIRTSYTPNWLSVDRQNESDFKNLQLHLMKTLAAQHSPKDEQ
ncbi:TPA: DUF6680 family protein [Vibrio parahaemolyticus]|uniref:DUF6680 family protein n=1 Tax=Vibrio parahaemolyticus TaxID=670 RepID=UPI00146CE133|nr:DUF6680 family protein [Vibrio parahaemolyticus]ELA7357916.1 hypothetical protein [Vibrio alginolyticus]MDF4694689.1 hypothetical protein [Vibrio parahaemolyticus]MDF5024561.1 hypothetical protein [Vibrio parahaemolyticus]MDF5043898.1 hypothetical protein [Vibrio parahaemolyticus]MDF5047883.1 hypothetical protein [Vibrio parahaemolyticus]